MATKLDTTQPIVTIYCRYNNRNARVRCIQGKYKEVEVIIDGVHPYMYLDDGYLQLAEKYYEEPPSFLAESFQKEVEAIKGICIHYFAGKIKVISDNTEVRSRMVPWPRTWKEIIEDIKLGWKSDIYKELKELGLPVNLFTRIRTVINFLRSRKREEQYLAPLSELHLGASWQKFFNDRSWLDEAVRIKGSPIYLA